MIRGSASFGMLSRDPSGWFNVTLDWTDTRIVRLESTPAGFINIWFYGDLTYATPYIWIGNQTGTTLIQAEVYDGSTFHTSAAVDIGTTPATVGLRYTASGTTVEFIVNDVVMDTLTVDLAPLAGIIEEHGLNDGGSEDLVSIGFWRRWQAALSGSAMTTDRWSLYPTTTTNLLASSPLEVITILTDTFGHDWTSSGTIATSLPFNTTCAYAATVAALPYQQLQQVCGATELWSTYLAPANADLSIATMVDAGTQTFTLNDGSCSGMNVLFTGSSGTHAFRATAGTQYWFHSDAIAGMTELVHTWTPLDSFEHVTTPMTWEPDLSDGVTVSVAGSWSAAGTKVELIAAAAEDLLLCAILAVPETVGSSAELQFSFWTGATGATPLGDISIIENGLAGDGFGPGTIELGVPLRIPAGARVMVSGSKSTAGSANWLVSIGVIPDGDVTSTASVLKVAPDHANGISLVPADLIGTPGAWVQLLAASTGDVVIDHLTIRWPNLMSKSDYTIEIGVGGAGAEVTADTYKGGSSDTAISTEGMPMLLYNLVPGTGLIPLGSRVSARLSTINAHGGANTNPWSVHMTYYEV